MPMNLYETFEDKVLKHCQKPGRYIGGEILSTKKDWSKVKLKWGLLFPDIYEIGISNLGIVTLYRILNTNPDILAERFYIPAQDVIEIMEKENIPPLSLENKMPPIAFDIIGITLPYELIVTNILKFFQLSGLPIRRNEHSFPIIIGGGALAYNPLPLAPFFDAFVIGDGEEILLPISEIVLQNKNNKMKILKELSKLEGVFVPQIHDTEKDRIKRIFVKDLNKFEPPIPIVPIVEGTFERLSMEVARGCTRGCRFCFSGMVGRPYRERDVENILNFLKRAIEETGFDEFSPSSLSITDFSCFENLFNNFYEYTSKNKIALSLPSLRVGSIKPQIAEKISSFRKTGFTIAPETSPSLQKALNKNIDFDSLIKDIETAFSMGWRNIKLYFMIGLPNEDEKDIKEINCFVTEILKTAKNLNPHITLSFSNFIPKPHTPLQWAKMASIEELLEKHKLLKKLFFPKKNVYLKLHNPYMSLMECVIARGDKNTATLIESGFNCGCIFDAWDDKFSFEKWQNASNLTKIEFDTYLKEKNIHDKLPWEFIDIGISKDFLIKEYNNYKKSVSTYDCRFDKCSSCGVCDFTEIKHVFSKTKEPIIDVKITIDATKNKNFIIVYEKTGLMKYLGNLDILRLWHRLLKISNVHLEYSKGHNPQPLIDGGWALPLGIESFCEIIKFKGFVNDKDTFLEKLNNILPEGLKIVSFSEYNQNYPIDVFAKSFEFLCLEKPDKIFLNDNNFDNMTITMIKKDGSKKEVFVKEQLLNFEALENCFYFTILMKPGGIKPIDFASKIVGREVSPYSLKKLRVFCEGGIAFGKRIGC
jgi:radical SAM family uncharacterized protein/radical SAM-linked protein